MPMAISVLLTLLSLHGRTDAKSEVPCFFIFGDSISDNGNNNNLKTLAKGGRIPLNQQIIQNHIIIIQGITKEMRNDLPAVKKHLNKCIYSIQVGSNDYINNYFIPKFYDTSRRYSLSGFTDLLIQQLSNQIKVLYDNSARKFAVYGLPPIGCTPNAISLYGTTNGSPCVDKLNQAAVLFNEKLTALVYQLNNNLTHAKFTYLNPPGSPIDPAEIVKNGTCCKTGGGAGELCIRNSKPCSNPKKHIFWDGVHLTEDQMQYIESFAKTDFTRVNLSPKERILDFKQSKLVAISVLLALSSLQNWENAKHANSTAPKPKVTCYFIFGDSISDNGNNNNLKTLTNVNYPPYGVDSPGGPTGRVPPIGCTPNAISLYGTNGSPCVDILNQAAVLFNEKLQKLIRELNKSLIQAKFTYLNPPGAPVDIGEIGTNFGHGDGVSTLFICNRLSNPIMISVKMRTKLKGVGSYPAKTTSDDSNHGARVPFNEQIQNHKIIISRITALMRNDSATKSHLSRCIYSVQIGSNGHINNYFKSTLYHSGRRYTLLEFSNVLVQQLSVQLKFTVYGVGMIGCTPDALSVFRADGLPCVQKLNDGATPFNEKLKPLLNELNRNLTNADFTDLIPSGNPTGLVTNSSCCQTGAGDGELCLPSSKPCSNPRQYIFWNGVHPTEAWNEMVVKSAYDSEKPGEAHPFNIRKLAMQPCPQALRS
ncbi:hypothetical protein F3Y22_tig00111852pilonHSYRG00026 [Hibiscus syriacus]|uniref:GDSL esterase/lipase n=1 Tax=Hibiscus syriacus TaxID=106335 RepID=A0A6A2YBG1_HIBSY|nr:hypothetical protein F3Y22_tig00111852pilonHSYRG00026 [Hibiscus syriacus]